MAHEFWLNERQWSALEPLIPMHRRGVKPQRNREILSGIVHVLKVGCRWRDCPEVYGPHTTIYNRFNRWSKDGEKALAAVIQEAYIQGISTRSVDDLVKAMGMEGVSKSQVSRLCGEIDERVNAFLTRPIEGDWPYVWLDATYIKVRRDHRIVSAAVIVAVGVNSDGRREVLGMTTGHSEAEPFWVEFLRSLARRGLRGVKLVISDAHEGLKAATTKVLSATWQRCRVHFMRNALSYAGKTQKRVVSAWVGTAFAQDDVAAASKQLRDVADQMRPRLPKLAGLLDEAEADVLAYMDFPAQQQRTSIRGDRPAIKSRHHRAAIKPCKFQRSRATLCRHRVAPSSSKMLFSHIHFLRFGPPMHRYSVRNAG